MLSPRSTSIQTGKNQDFQEGKKKVKGDKIREGSLLFDAKTDSSVYIYLFRLHLISFSILSYFFLPGLELMRCSKSPSCYLSTLSPRPMCVRLHGLCPVYLPSGAMDAMATLLRKTFHYSLVSSQLCRLHACLHAAFSLGLTLFSS